MRIVRLADPIVNNGQQPQIPLGKEFGEMAQAFMAPPDRGLVGKEIGTERDCLFRHAPSE